MSDKVVQVSVFLENRPGALARVTDVLCEAGIDLRVLTVAETREFGILRIIVSDPDSAVAALSKAGYTSEETEVVAVELGDKPGGLYQLAAVTGEAEINIDYLYAFVVETHRKAVAIVRTEDAETLRSAVTAKGMKVLSPAQLYSL
jgi:hypothetical protein